MNPVQTNVTIDGVTSYPCLAITDRNGDLILWNGFVAMPWFDRPTLERIVHDFAARNDPGDLDVDRFVWDGDTLLRFWFEGDISRAVFHPDDDSQAFVRTVIRPSPLIQPGELRYAFGHREFAWSQVDEDEAAAMQPAELSVDTVQHRCTRTDAHRLGDCVDYATLELTVVEVKGLDHDRPFHLGYRKDCTTCRLQKAYQKAGIRIVPG